MGGLAGWKADNWKRSMIYLEVLVETGLFSEFITDEARKPTK